MHRQLLLASFIVTLTLALSACSNSNDKKSTSTSQLNPNAEPSADDGESGSDTAAIAGLWDGSTTQGDTSDVVYWYLDENGVLTRYDYQQDSAQTAGEEHSGENCYVIDDPISVTREEGDSYSFFNVATTAVVNENTLTITFVEADVNDLNNNGNTTEIPTLKWTLLSSLAVEDLNSCAADETNQTDDVGSSQTDEPETSQPDSDQPVLSTELEGDNTGNADIPFDDSEGRPLMTRAECASIGGQVIGDIGDGAIHRPEYRCESGNPPVARITYLEGEPIAPEGEVCCL